MSQAKRAQDDPQSCNVYPEPRFPDGIYDHINQFWDERAEADENGAARCHDPPAGATDF